MCVTSMTVMTFIDLMHFPLANRGHKNMFTNTPPLSLALPLLFSPTLSLYKAQMTVVCVCDVFEAISFWPKYK